MRSGGALKALVAFGVLMLLLSWFLRRAVLPEKAAPGDPIGVLRTYYARNYVPDDLLNLDALGASCQRGVVTSCTELGRRLAALRVELPELAPPACVERDLFERSCDRDDMTACAELAHFLRRPACGPPDPERAYALYDRACRAHVAFACDWRDELG